MIADAKQMKCAVGAKEQARPIESAPEFLRHEAALAAGEGGVKHVRQARKARVADIHPHDIGVGEHRARIAVDAHDVQDRRIARPKQRAHCQCHGQ
jgi:hypothetical protein